MPPDPKRVGSPAGLAEPLSLRHLAESVVLIIDDQQANVELLRKVLSRAGMVQLHGVTDARQVLTTFQQVMPDLVLLDLHMPHLDGFAILEALSGVIPADEYLPVVVLTADTTKQARDRALAAGTMDFVTKPFDQTEVLLRTRNLLEARAMHLGLRRHNAELAAELRWRSERDELRDEESRRRVERIQSVLAGTGLTMVFQPIVDLASGEVFGVEALARFQGEPGEPSRPPDVWFAEAQEAGLGSDLELAAVSAAMRSLNDLPEDVVLSVNVSAAAVCDRRMAGILEGVPGHRIVLEITEHVRVADYERLHRALDRLRVNGFRVAVDDAGAGFAGLQHILRLRPDIIKLDLSLTQGIDVDPIRRALGLSLVGFARDIGAALIAEGIETAAELDVLRGLGVRWGQGYYLARPGPIGQIAALVSQPVHRSSTHEVGHKHG